MGKPNWKNRTLWTCDNLPVMRGMNSASVDLIYLDPPFNSKKNYAAPIGSQAAGAAFQDTWSLDDVKREWVEDIEADNTATWSTITAAGFTHGESSQAYLTYMAIRLLEMRRLLRPTGSIYLHCDPTMSHYLKLLMDAIFGAHNFRNEVSWSYRGREMHTTKKFNAKHDTVLFYAQSPAAYVRMKAVAIPYDRAERLKMLRRKIHVDDDGREWVWETRGQASGQQPYKRLVDDIVAQGRPLNDVWGDLQFLRGNHPERTGYPTQKPLKLLERIIKASSDEGDIVLDPFCGCATTCVSAEMLGRQWAGIDIELKARDLVLERLQRQADEALLAGGSFPEIHHLTRPPKRTDPDAPSRSRDIKQVLYRRQEGRCAGQCGADSQGRKLDLDLFEVDHIVPRSKGGADVDDNLQLLCPTCNRRKGSRTMAHLLSLTSE